MNRKTFERIFAVCLLGGLILLPHLIRADELKIKKYNINSICGATTSGGTKLRMNMGESIVGVSQDAKNILRSGYIIPYGVLASTSTYTPTPSPTPAIIYFSDFGGQIISKKHVYAAPNPVRGNTAHLNIFVKNRATLKGILYTMTNREVLSFQAEHRNEGLGLIQKELQVGNLANGVYLMYLEAKSDDGKTERVIKKIALIK